MTAFPETCLRGLRNKDFFLKEIPALSAMAFEPNYKIAEQREDGANETSINWEDDKHTLAFTLRNHQIAAFGVARLRRVSLDEANSLPNLRRYVSVATKCVLYERSPMADNQYHGNILFSSTVPRPLIRMVAGYLAMQAEYIPSARFDARS